MPKTTPASHSWGCPSTARSLWVGGAGCHGPWAALEASPLFRTRLIFATLSPPPSQGGTQIMCLPVAKHFQIVRAILSRVAFLQGHQRRVWLPGPWARHHAGRHAQRHPAAQGHPLGQTPTGDLRWGGPVPCPCSESASEASAHQSVAGPGESRPGPQGGVGGWWERGCSPAGCGSWPAPRHALAGVPPGASLLRWAAEPSLAAGARGVGGSPGRRLLYRRWQPSQAGCVRVTRFLCGLPGDIAQAGEQAVPSWSGSLC